MFNECEVVKNSTKKCAEQDANQQNGTEDAACKTKTDAEHGYRKFGYYDQAQFAELKCTFYRREAKGCAADSENIGYPQCHDTQKKSGNHGAKRYRDSSSLGKSITSQNSLGITDRNKGTQHTDDSKPREIHSHAGHHQIPLKIVTVDEILHLR